MTQDIATTTKANPQHSAASPEHYTPIEFIEAARRTMGEIDLDPASTESVNTQRIRASQFFARADDGLSKAWHGRVWLNPPGGRVKNKSSAAIWWAKLAEEYQANRVTEAVFLGFSIELLATSQDACIWPGEMPFCIPRLRIEFLQERDGKFVSGESPTHSNILIYLPPVKSVVRSTETFAKEFESFGKVCARR